jgi:hypothetical protein
VKFIQFRRFEVRVYPGGKPDYLLPGKIKTGHGDHALSTKGSDNWYLDANRTDTPQYGLGTHLDATGVYSRSSWMIDVPASPLAGLSFALDTLKKAGTLAKTKKIVSTMFATTYVILNGSPVARIDWQSSVTWEKGQTLADAEKSMVIPKPKITTDWNSGATTKAQYDLLLKFPPGKRIWTTAP